MSAVRQTGPQRGGKRGTGPVRLSDRIREDEYEDSSKKLPPVSADTGSGSFNGSGIFKDSRSGNCE